MVAKDTSARRNTWQADNETPEREKKKNLKEREDGEAAGEDEGGGVRSVSVSAEDNERALERPSQQDPPQSLRELDQRHSPPRPSRWHLLVCPAL
ncbi:cytochrome reductase [Tripterygium wilfordii]|uniref:Cytochrome reductase n=1 Tax=Tripterygium wilfordii TaxID=458696 RepID=A0A7J7CWL6_TRIWF|nr:cytochrome reductase [Tripterygium wilfordii]